MLSILVILS